MKKRRGKRDTPDQIIKKLREADLMLAAGKTIGQLCQTLEISRTNIAPLAPVRSGCKAEGGESD
jgi:putative transposase